MAHLKLLFLKKGMDPKNKKQAKTPIELTSVL